MTSGVTHGEVTTLSLCPSVAVHTHPDQAIFGLNLLGIVQGVVDQSEARALSAAKLCPEPEAEDHIAGGLVHLNGGITG